MRGVGVAMFKVDIFHMSKFIVGDPGEPYCKIPIKSLKILNKFLGTTIDNSKIEFRKIEDLMCTTPQNSTEFATIAWGLIPVHPQFITHTSSI